MTWKEKAKEEGIKQFEDFILQYENNVESIEHNACKEALDKALSVAEKEIERLKSTLAFRAVTKKNEEISRLKKEVEFQISLRETAIKTSQMQTKEIEKLQAEKKEIEKLIEDNETMLCNCEEQRKQEGCHNKDCNYIEVRDKIEARHMR